MLSNFLGLRVNKANSSVLIAVMIRHLCPKIKLFSYILKIGWTLLNVMHCEAMDDSENKIWICMIFTGI